MEVKTDMTTNTYPNKPSRTVGKIAKRTRESRNNQKTNLRAKELAGGDARKWGGLQQT